MTERPSGRHRAPHKSTSSALTTLTGPLSMVSGRMETVRRSGVIIAMSSGLMASMALPAHAVAAVPAEVSGPQTASMPAVPASDAAAFFAAPEGGLLSLPVGLALDDGTVSAPAAATLDFDHTAFVAVPAPAKARPGVDATRGPSTAADQGQAADEAPTTRRAARATTASSTSSKADSASIPVPASALGSQAVAIASRYIGRPYRYGASGPGSFDCSGLVQYVFAQLGKHLPRTAAEQAAAVRHIPRSQARPGDLVLFPGGGHIGIYVGDGMMLDAPHTGTTVQIRKIYSAGAMFGRVL